MRERAVFISIFAVLVLTGCPQAIVTTPVAAADDTNVIFYDTFTSVKGEWQQFSGTWEVSDGWLIQRSDDPRKLNCIRYIETPRVNDAVIETEVRLNPYRPQQWTTSDEDQEMQNNIRRIIGAGIVFRMQDKDNYYMYRLAGEEGVVLGKMVKGEWFDLKNPRVRDIMEGLRISFYKENTYRLKVVVRDNRIQCYINNEPAIDVKDDRFQSGQVGLCTFKTAAEFDFIKITAQ